MPSLTAEIELGTELHARIVSAVRDRVQASQRHMDSRNKWKDAEDKSLAYLPEREQDRARRQEREAGKPSYTTIQIPYSYAVLQSAHTYWSTVFLSRAPVFQFDGRHGESQQQVQALEALMSYQLQVGEMLVPLYIWLYDAGKYGVGIIGHHWDEQVTTVSEIQEIDEFALGVIPTGKKRKQKITQRIRGYHGNRIYNIRPQRFFPDPRVPMSQFQKGEYCAVYNELSWNAVIRKAERGHYTNIEFLRERSGKPNSGSFSSGSEASTQEGTHNTSERLDIPQPWAFSPNEKNTSGTIKIYECYIDLVPSDWGLGQGKSLEKWVFTISSDYHVVLGAAPLGAYHNRFPFELIEIDPEGYGLTSRGIPEVVEPIQNTLDWLINSHFYNVRKTLNNQFLVDPSRVIMNDLLNPMPGGMIRLSPAAYGSDPNTAIRQLQTVDVTGQHLNDIGALMQFGERIHGVNDQVMGISPDSGRRSATEVRTTSSFSINRLRTSSEFMSAMGFTPLSQTLLQSTQQYYDAEEKYRIVGDLALTATEKFIKVDPESIQGFFDFVPVDGTLPIDRFAQANLWRDLFAQMSQNETLIAQYDMGKIFAWIAQLTGLKNINQFRVDIQPDALLQAQAQQGNVIPIGGANDPAGPPSSGPNAQQDQGRNVGLTQTSNLGPAG